MRFIMRLSQLPRNLHELHPDDLKTLVFKSSQDLPHQTSLHRVRLQDNQCAFHVFLEWIVRQKFLSAIELASGEVVLMVGQALLSAIGLASGEVLFSRANSSLLGGLKPALAN